MKTKEVIHTPQEREALMREEASQYPAEVRDARRNTGWLSASLDYALTLLEWGGAKEAEAASDIIRFLISTQNRDSSSWTDWVGLRRGNYLRGADDAYPYDLNVSTFHMLRFIPICRRHRDKLDGELLGDLFRSMSLALEHIWRRDVTLDYTNIALMECAALVCGGELVGRDEMVRRGLGKLQGWLALTANKGIREYNSTAYLTPDLVATSVIQEFSGSAKAQLMARLAEERLWWHVASHYHPETCQWSAPQSRAYALDRVGGPSGLKWIVYKVTGLAHLVDPALREHVAGLALMRDDSVFVPWAPARPASARRPTPATEALLSSFHCREYVRRRFFAPSAPSQTVERTRSNQDITTYRTRTYTVGCANHHWQNPHKGNLFVWYRAKPEYPLRHRLLYTEFCRRQNTRTSMLGYSVGAGDRSRYIMLYGLKPGKEGLELPELSVDLVIPDRSQLDELWSGEQSIDNLPVTLAPEDPLFIREGEFYFAILPLPLVDLGRKAPVTLGDDAGDLQISIWAYEGSPRTFADVAPCALLGYVLEVGDADEFGGFERFRNDVSEGEATVRTDAGHTVVTYRRGGQELSLTWDPAVRIIEIQPGQEVNVFPLCLDRRINGRLVVAPILDDPWAQVRAEEPILLHGGALAPTTLPVGLWATPQQDAYALWQPHADPVTIDLDTPVGDVRSPAFPMGLLCLHRVEDGTRLDVEAAEPVSGLLVRPTEGPLSVTVNGREVSAEAPVGPFAEDGWLELSGRQA